MLKYIKKLLKKLRNCRFKGFAMLELIISLLVGAVVTFGSLILMKTIVIPQYCAYFIMQTCQINQSTEEINTSLLLIKTTTTNTWTITNQNPFFVDMKRLEARLKETLKDSYSVEENKDTITIKKI